MPRRIVNAWALAIYLTSLLALSFSVPQQVMAKSTKEGLPNGRIGGGTRESLPDRRIGEGTREGLPGRRIGGGTRGCSLDPKNLVALMPDNNFGLTKEAHPNFFFYLPKTSEKTMVEFVLQDDKSNLLSETTFMTSNSTGVVNVSLPNSGSFPSLAVGKKYHWYLSIICEEDNRANDIFVDGWIERIELAPELAKKLEHSSPTERAVLYASNGLWYDALTTLAELLDTYPNDSRFTASWKQLLQSVSLDTIAQEPLLKRKVYNQN